MAAKKFCLNDSKSEAMDYVCEGRSKQVAANLVPALTQGVFSPLRICNEVLKVCTEPTVTTLDEDEFVRRQLDAKPEEIKNNDYIDNLYRQIRQSKEERPTVRSVQLADMHLDFYYTEGAPTQCDFPICCRINGPGSSPAKDSPLAQKWGDFACDMPP